MTEKKNRRAAIGAPNTFHKGTPWESAPDWKHRVCRTVRADPDQRPSAAIILAAFVDWAGSPDDPVYLSMSTIMALTGFSESTIDVQMKQLVRSEQNRAGYLEKCGVSKGGAIEYRIRNDREAYVEDVIRERFEKRLAANAEKAKSGRAKSKPAAAYPPIFVGDAGGVDGASRQQRTPENLGIRTPQKPGIRTPRKLPPNPLYNPSEEPLVGHGPSGPNAPSSTGSSSGYGSQVDQAGDDAPLRLEAQGAHQAAADYDDAGGYPQGELSGDEPTDHATEEDLVAAYQYGAIPRDDAPFEDPSPGFEAYGDHSASEERSCAKVAEIRDGDEITDFIRTHDHDLLITGSPENLSRLMLWIADTYDSAAMTSATRAHRDQRLTISFILDLHREDDRDAI